jgi:hypothetical protein
MSKALETGKTLADLILAKLPENLREGVRTAFAAPEAADALTELGARGLAQSDYSRQLDEIRTKEQTLADAQAQINQVHKDQTDWYAVNKPALDEYAKLKAAGGAPPVAPVAPAPAAGISKEDLEKYLGERDRSYAAVLGLATTLASRHYQHFNEVLDTQDLIAFAEKNRLPLADAYAQKFAEPIKVRNEKLETERIDKLVQEKLATERQTLGQPFPLRNQDPSVLDNLNKEAPDKAQYSAEAAAAEYARLTAGA